jgi:hypothetical protein
MNHSSHFKKPIIGPQPIIAAKCGVTNGTQLLHVLATSALEEIPMFLEDVMVKLKSMIYLFSSSFLFRLFVCEIYSCMN